MAKKIAIIIMAGSRYYIERLQDNIIFKLTLLLIFYQGKMIFIKFKRLLI